MYELNQESLDQIMQIPTDNIKEPGTPPDIYLLECAYVYDLAKGDRQALSTHGLSIAYIDSMPERIDLFRKSQSIWVKERNELENARKTWSEESPGLYELRDELLAAYRYAFRKDDRLLVKLTKISEGRRQSDLLLDLSDLAILGKANTKLLKAIKFDLTKLDEASKLSHDMTILLGAAKNEQKQNASVKVIRDRAYTWLKEAMDEIRDCAKYTFRKESTRLSQYASEYLREKNRARKNNSDDTDDTIEGNTL